jgi:hypothetical protein
MSYSPERPARDYSYQWPIETTGNRKPLKPSPHSVFPRSGCIAVISKPVNTCYSSEFADPLRMRVTLSRQGGRSIRAAQCIRPTFSHSFLAFAEAWG